MNMTITNPVEKIPKCVSDTLLSIGITPNLKGFRYAGTAITLVAKNPDLMITKHVYPEVASIYKATSSQVERAIRHAVDIVFDTQRAEDVIKVIGVGNYSLDKGKVSNAEFVYSLAYKLQGQILSELS